jgi:hypothetical protein
MQEQPTTPIHPVVALHDNYGVIHITQEDTGVYGEDGTVTNEGLIIHRIYDLEGLAHLGEFMQRYIWCNDLGWWKLVPEKPNNYAYWDGTIDPPGWNWDRSILVEDVKIHRARKLFETDWTQMPDSPLTSEQQAAWALYRQELRDLPSNLSGNEVTLDDVTWPVQPTLS